MRWKSKSAKWATTTKLLSNYESELFQEIPQHQTFKSAQAEKRFYIIVQNC
jgi:hypothetical protein